MSRSSPPCAAGLPAVLLASIAFLPPALAKDAPPTPLAPGQNVLILVADDLGVDSLGVYPESVQHAPTPNLDALANEGVTFRRAYSNPTCSTTRATLQTGRYSFRTGVGTIVQNNPSLPSYYALQLSETTLPEMLDAGTGGTYDHTAIGKWHLGNDSVGGALAPNLAGYDHFDGILYNVPIQPGTPNPYSHWQHVQDGSTSVSMTYAAIDKVDEAIAWIGSRTQPWLCYVSFNLPHAPFHRPPAHLHSYSLPKSRPGLGDDALPYYQAMVQAMDSEIGRLLASVDLGETHVLFLGDNGTPQQVTRPPFDPAHAKGTVYEGGIHVPLIVHSPAVVARGRDVHGLVNTTDVFATVADLAGVDLTQQTLPKLDSRSLLPYLQDPSQPSARKFVYAERFSPNGSTAPPEWSRTVRNHRYKLIRRRGTGGNITQEFFDLSADPLETHPLPVPPSDPGGRRAYSALRKRMKKLGGLQ